MSEKILIASTAIAAIERGDKVSECELFGAELDGKLWLGLWPDDMLKFADVLYAAGQRGDPVLAVFADGIAYRFGMERKQ